MAGTFSPGFAHSVALTASGRLVCWGDPTLKACSPPQPAPGDRFVAVAAGGRHCVGLTAAGRLRAWGCNAEGQCHVPEATHDDPVVAVSAGAWHSLALTEHGSVRTWGRDRYGECGEAPELRQGDRFVAAAAGSYHNLALAASGRIVAWGRNDVGQCDVPECLGRCRVAALAGGAKYSVAVTDEGALLAWGDNSKGQCEVPLVSDGDPFVSVYAGAFHCLALTKSGQLRSWGDPSEGRCNAPWPPMGDRFVAAAAGFHHCLALTASGCLWAWGSNHQGQCDVPQLPSEEEWAVPGSKERKHRRFEQNLQIPSREPRSFFPRGWEPALDLPAALARFGLDAKQVKALLSRAGARRFELRQNLDLAVFSVEDAAAVLAWTEDNDRIFLDVSYNMRVGGNWSEAFLERCRDYLWHLSEALGALPPYKGQVYRSLPDREQEHLYSPGEVIVWQPFASATKSPLAALRYLSFIDNDPNELFGTVFIVQSKAGRDIEELSAFPDEEEVLFRENSRFVVVEQLLTFDEKLEVLPELQGLGVRHLDVLRLVQLPSP